MIQKLGLCLLLFLPLHAQDAAPAEATSFNGLPLLRTNLPTETLAKYTAKLAEAQQRLRTNPKSIDEHIWVGRRLAYLGRYKEAIAFFGETIRRDPHDARIYRHRGHRFITTRQLDRAIRDLERGSRLMKSSPDKMEPDGLPNAAGIPTSSLYTNIWYHLGLARYLKADFSGAADAYRACLEASNNDDMRIAALDWLYRALRRDGKHAEVSKLLTDVKADTKLLESGDYLKCLLMYQGKLDGESLIAEMGSDLSSATLAYGVANYFALQGKHKRAEEILKQVTAKGHWAAFGYIAAEADLARK